MPRKQTIVKETAAPAAPAARAAKPKTPRVKTAHHSKTASVEPVAALTSAVEIMEYATEQPGVIISPEAVIEKIAYGYWESRGCQGGSAIEDWLRAEQEYRQRTAAARQ